jgi:hypothetical protein
MRDFDIDKNGYFNFAKKSDKRKRSLVQCWIIKAVLQWYRWQSAWATLIDGIIGVITLGHVKTSFALTAAKIGAKKRHELGKPL